MKVAYVLSMFPCWSETFILREMLELRRRGVELTIFSLKPCTETLVHPDAATLVANNLVVHASAWRGMARFAWCGLRHPLRVGGVLWDVCRNFHGSWRSLATSVASMVLAADFLPALQARGIEHIHAPWGTYPSTAALFHARVAGYSFSFTTRAHDLFLEDHALAIKFRDAHFAQTITQYNRALIMTRYPGIAPGTLHVIHSALDPAMFTGARQPVAPPLLLSIGRMVEMKGFIDLIEACALLRDRHLPFRCRIVGDGPLKPDLRARIARHQLGAQVELSDPMAQDEIRRLLTRASCFVLPCITAADGDQDGIPNVLMEAMAAGVPVISCPTSGVPELVVHEATGLLTAPRDPSALADAIQRMLSDPILQARLVQAGRAKIEAEFDIGTNAARLAALFAASRSQRNPVRHVGDGRRSDDADVKQRDLSSI